MELIPNVYLDVARETTGRRRVQLHYGTVLRFFYWLLPGCARHLDKNRPIIQFNTDPVLSGQLLYCSRTELSNLKEKKITTVR